MEVLGRLRDMRVENIPEVVFFGACEGRAYFVENFVEESAASHPPLSESEMLSNLLTWMRRFYSQTRIGTLEPQELIQRAENVSSFAEEFVDLTDAFCVLDKSKPSARIPAVCRHGDVANVNFILTSRGMVATDFGFGRFNEPPSEPYALVSPAKLRGDTKYLDVLSALDNVDPFFLAMYENIIHLGEELRMLHELEENLLVVNRIGYVASIAQIGKIEELKLNYHEPRWETKVRS
jgi:hypothetical protein